VHCGRVEAEWTLALGSRPKLSTPYDPKNDAVYMAMVPALLIPSGLVDKVCTQKQKEVARRKGGVFMVRGVLV
jgi:hypothetical protein